MAWFLILRAHKETDGPTVRPVRGRTTSQQEAQKMKRRSFLKGAAGVAAMAAAGNAPALAQASGSRVLRMIPHANLTSVDPIWTTAYITRNHAYMVWDTLYGTD